MTYDECRNLFHYRDDGTLWWKRRGVGQRMDLTKPAGSIGNQSGYRIIRHGSRKLYQAHRLIWLYHNPEWKINEAVVYNKIKHNDGDKLNNRIENLSELTLVPVI